jgi:hypothetical protein
VTAVVAVMKVVGSKNRNSRNTSLGKMLNKQNKWLNLKKKHLNRSKNHQDGLSRSISNVSERLLIKEKLQEYCLILDQEVTTVLLEKGLISTQGTSNGTFQTKKVGEIDISIVEYSASKSVNLTPDIMG